MNVITSYPVIVDNKKQSPGEYYLNADASLIKGNTARIKAFQNWLDVKYPNWNNGKQLLKGKGYGNFGPATEGAWNLYGDEFVTNANIISGAITGDPTPKAIEDAAKKGLTWDKVKKTWVAAKESGAVDFLKGLFGGGAAQPTDAGATDVSVTETTIDGKKGMSTTTKILIGGGVLLGLGLIIYFATKGSSSKTVVVKAGK